MPDVRRTSRFVFARLAAIAVMGSTLLSSHAAPTFAKDSLKSDHTTAYFEPQTFSEEVKTERVIACFDGDSPDIGTRRQKFVDQVQDQLADLALAQKGNSDLSDGSSEKIDVVFDSRPLDYIPCLTAEVTTMGRQAVENAPDVTSVREDIQVHIMHHEMTAIGGALLSHTGADKAHHKGIEGKGQRIAITDTGGNFDSPDDSYRESLAVETACIGVNYPPHNLESLCEDGADTVIGEYAGKVVPAHFIGADHGDTEGQVAHYIAPQAEIVHIALATVLRSPGGDQLAFYASEMVRAIDIALALNADSIVQSLVTAEASAGACTDYYPAYNVAVAAAHLRDVPVFVSTGNNGEEVNWPGCADIDGMYPITTVRFDGTIPSFAGYRNPRVLSAMGEGVLIQGLNGAKRTTSGTSYASPSAAALYGLFHSVVPEMTSDDAMELFRRTAGDATSVTGDRVPDMRIDQLLSRSPIGQLLGTYFPIYLPELLLRREN